MAKNKSIIDTTNTTSQYGRNNNVMEKQKEISDANKNVTYAATFEGEQKDIKKMYGQVSNIDSLFDGGKLTVSASNGKTSHYDFEGIENDKTKMQNLINTLEENHNQILENFMVLDHFWEGEVSYKGITSFIELSFYFENTILQSLKEIPSNYGRTVQIMKESEKANVSLLSREFK